MVTFNCLLTGERSDERSPAQIYSTLSSSCQAEFRLGHPAEFHKHNKLHSRSTISGIFLDVKLSALLITFTACPTFSPSPYDKDLFLRALFLQKKRNQSHDTYAQSSCKWIYCSCIINPPTGLL